MPSRTLPKPDDYMEFFELMVANGNSAHLENNLPVTEMQAAKLTEGDGNIKWIGKLDDVIVVGYPYIVSHETIELDPETMTPGRVINYTLPDLGIPLKILYWSSDYHGFCCVRSDVYVK